MQAKNIPKTVSVHREGATAYAAPGAGADIYVTFCIFKIKAGMCRGCAAEAGATVRRDHKNGMSGKTPLKRPDFGVSVHENTLN
jgi:hypothetical protein